MIHRFGEITVDEARREVRRGERLIAAQARHFDVLLYLIRHSDRIVPRTELEDQFWPDRDWPDHAIDTCLSGIRKLLRGSDALIRSSYARGVRFVGPAAAGEPAGAPAATALPPVELLGRGAETARLFAAVDDLLAGHGGVALISGEAGIGKTRLAEELIRHARLRGADAPAGTCRTDAPPFAPWRDVIESYAAGRDAQDLRTTFGRGAAELGRIAPSLVAEATAAIAPADAESARDRLIEEIAGFLARAAARHPIVLLLDDIHWADISSLVVLQRIARLVREDPVLIAATYRDPNGHSSASFDSVLDTLRQSPRCIQVQPPPLTPSESRSLVERLSGGAAADGVVGDIITKAEGNPFFLGEYWRHLAQYAGTADRSAAPGVVPVPTTIGTVLGLRLERVSPPSREMLDAASVIGREFEDAVLAESCGLSAEELHDALDEAAEQRIAMPVRGAPHRYRFVHALIHEAVYARLADDRRRDLHQRVAACFERRDAANPDTALAELAHHCREAGDPDKAITFATRAGEQAYAMLAYEDAARHFELAVATIEAHRRSLSLHRYDLLLALGDARANAGDAAGAAAAYARADADHSALFLPKESERTPVAGGQALTAQAHLVTRFEFFIRMASDPLLIESWQSVEARREAHRRTALANARRTGNPAVLADALLRMRWHMQGPRFIAEHLPLSTELVDAAEESGSFHVAQEGRLFRVQDLLERGRADAAGMTIDALARVADRRPEPLYAWALKYLRAMQATMATRLEEAETLAQEALLLGMPVVGDLAQAVFGTQIGFIRAMQGRLTELADVSEFFAQQHPEMLVPQITLLEINCQRGKFDEARRQFDFIAEGNFARIQARPVTWINSVLTLAMACCRLGDRVRAAQLYEMLRPLAGYCAVFPLGIAVVGSIDGFLGVLAGTMRRWKNAAVHFEAGIATNERMGSPGTVAHMQQHYAEMLLAKGGRAATARARELLAAAAAIARERNMPGVLAEVDALR